MNIFILFVLSGIVFLAQISIAPRFVFWGVSPDLIFAFFIASFLFLKNKKVVFVSAIATGIFAAFPSLLPAAPRVFAFFVLAMILFLPEKFLAEAAKKIFVLAAAFPLSLVYQISILIFIFAAGKIPFHFGFPSLINGESGLDFGIIFSRASLAQAFLNSIAAAIFYLCMHFIFKRKLKNF